jgi:hypothetical protein
LMAWSDKNGPLIAGLVHTTMTFVGRKLGLLSIAWLGFIEGVVYSRGIYDLCPRESGWFVHFFFEFCGVWMGNSANFAALLNILLVRISPTW